MAGRQSAPHRDQPLPEHPLHIGAVIPHRLLFLIPARSEIGFKGLQAVPGW